MVHDARADMDFGDFFSHGGIPEVHLGQARDNGRSRTVPAVQQPGDFSIRVFVYTEFTLFSVESHQTSAASDADIIHGFFTPDDQNFFHMVSFHPVPFLLFIVRSTAIDCCRRFICIAELQTICQLNL
jgi:hypothetical protein